MNSMSGDGRLSEIERSDFDYVVASAKHLGWIDEATSMSVTCTTQLVVVHASGDASEQENAYGHDDRWIYKLMSDLSQGHWRKGAFRM
jgi:hypothetical protein